MADDLAFEEENFPKTNYGFNRSSEELCEMKTFGDLLSEAVHSPYFDLFWAYFVIHILVLLYHVLFKWKFRTSRNVKCYSSSIRKYTGWLIGVFSLAISWKIIFSEESCLTAIYLALFSFLLSCVAVLCAHGMRGKANALFSVIICAICTVIVLTSIKNQFYSKTGQDYTAQFVYGILHLALGIELFLMSQRKELIGEGVSSHPRNVFFVELMN